MGQPIWTDANLRTWQPSLAQEEPREFSHRVSLQRWLVGIVGRKLAQIAQTICHLRKIVFAQYRVDLFGIIRSNYSAGVADVRQGGTFGLPAKTLVNASITLTPFLRMVEI